eukprot:Pgem_evm1s9961
MFLSNKGMLTFANEPLVPCNCSSKCMLSLITPRNDISLNLSPNRNMWGPKSQSST